MSRFPLSRRTVLRGVGVTIFLPLLEAMEPHKAGATGNSIPKRFAVLYMPNGVHPNAWTPKGRGKEFELSPVLSPLEKMKSDLLVLTDLMNKNSIPGDGHYAKVAPFLTGTAITKTTGSNLRCGSVSLDQLIAQHIGHNTPLPSLELSTEPPTTYVDTNVGYTALYGSHISWSNPTTPVTREIDPQLAFDRLFHHTQSGKAKGASPNDKSILDLVTADTKRLQSKVGTTDRQKLDEYFESVRSVEKRIAFDVARRRAQYQEDPLARKAVEQLGGRIKSYYQDPAKIRERGIDHTEQVRLMLDLMVLGFWTDSTRVTSFMFGNEVTGRNFSFLSGVDGGHHQISHHENDKKKMEQYKQINIWHTAQYAYMLEKMRGIKEGEGTLLDNSLVMLGAGMRDGNAHSPFNLPLVLAGQCGGVLPTGRHLVYEKNTPLCNLYHGLLTAMEIPIVSFGDSTGDLPGLFDPKSSGTLKAG